MSRRSVNDNRPFFSHSLHFYMKFAYDKFFFGDTSIFAGSFLKR
ncbi:unnamed protein product [Brugia timori]|uniref:Uncharacterized protein n=1 Tax=Brugia timori TaxID=42155 RepID=A0A0R3Q8I3_9BILA|nr:unnamed protein product [Brugia timori]